MSSAPTMMIECSIKGDSGWVRGDIEKDPRVAFTGDKRTTPGRVTIPNTGFMTEIVKEKVGGKDVETKKNVRIRYIKNCPYIKLDEQKLHGFEPSRDRQQDEIAIYDGTALIAREGDTGLYDYLMAVNYNGSNPNRSKKASVLFYVVELDKRREVINDVGFISARAVSAVEALVKKQGTEKTGYSYVYQEAKIDGLCQLVHVWGETYAEKISALTIKAKENPEGFLKKVKAFEETTLTEVSHALQLNVIRFEGDAVVVAETKKVLATLPKGTKENQKAEVFADLLRTSEYYEQHTLLNAMIDAAKEKEFA